MRSGRPKILHLLGGQPLVRYPVALVRECRRSRGAWSSWRPGRRPCATALADLGRALRRAARAAGHGGRPPPGAAGGAGYGHRAPACCTATCRCSRAPTLAALLARHRASRAAATVLTFVPADPTGYGRIRRGRDGRVRAIVEERDATPAERRGRECNSGIYCFDPRRLWPALEAVARPAPDQRAGRGVPDGRDRRSWRGAAAGSRPCAWRTRSRSPASTTGGSSRRSRGCCGRAPSTRS